MFDFVRDIGQSLQRKAAGFVLKGDANQPLIAPYITSFTERGGLSKSLVTPHGLSMMVAIADNDNSLFSDLNEAMIYAIHLPFTASAHIFAVSPDSRVSLDPSYAEPVVLEGDYQQFFQLYAERGQQVDTRYVLDPKAMETTMTYLHSYIWELWGNTLYLVCQKQAISPDIVDHIVNEICPSIAKSTALDLAPSSDYQEGNRLMRCPTCEDVLLMSTYAWACPAGHGFLMSQKQAGSFVTAPNWVRHSPRIQSVPDDDVMMQAAMSLSGAMSGQVSCPFCLQTMYTDATSDHDHTYTCGRCRLQFLRTASQGTTA
ncbi:MAG: hypothetical protein WAU02_01210 [Candidatus Saccharimonadales bacterium]